MALLTDLTTSLRVLGRSGIIRPYSPRKLAGLGVALLRWGTGPAGGFTALAVREPHRIGLVDELGELTFGELHRRSNALPRQHRIRRRPSRQSWCRAPGPRDRVTSAKQSVSSATLNS